MNPHFKWTPSRRLARVLRDASFVLAVASFAAAPFCRGDIARNLPILIVVLPLFVGVFPLFAGAILILTSRVRGQLPRNWVPVLMQGVPGVFLKTYMFLFYGVWLFCMYIMLRTSLGGAGWPDPRVNQLVLFALIPAVFYLTCAGAYWSAMRGSEQAE